MIKRVVYSILSIVAGLFLLVFPVFLDYFNKDAFIFDISSFLSDYPVFRYAVGVFLTIAGIFEIVNSFLLQKNKTVFVIQRAGDGDYGNVDLHYSKLSKGDCDELVYTNLATLKNHSDKIVDLEKKQIKCFYDKLPSKKQIAFLSIATIPSIVYAGYVIGEAGRKIKYYHWNREKAKAKRIIGHCQKHFLKKDEEVVPHSNSKEYVVCISTSYPVKKEQVIKQFDGKNIVFYCIDNPNKDAIKTRKELLDIAGEVRKAISNIDNQCSLVHLILQCSSELCFAIGQKLNSPGLPKIKVYSWNNKKIDNSWDWCITLD